MTQSTFRRALGWAALSLLLLGPVGLSVASAGGKPAALALAFDDLLGDAITSDGLGAYDARSARDGSRTVSTGSRAIHFDYSSALTWWSFGPFGYGVAAGDIDNVTMTITLADATSGTVEFDFKGLDPDSGSPTDFYLSQSVSVEQSGDTWILRSSSEATLYYLWQSSGIRGHGHLYAPYWERAGIFDMPWGAQVGP